MRSDTRLQMICLTFISAVLSVFLLLIRPLISRLILFRSSLVEFIRLCLAAPLRPAMISLHMLTKTFVTVNNSIANGGSEKVMAISLAQWQARESERAREREAKRERARASERKRETGRRRKMTRKKIRRSARHRISLFSLDYQRHFPLLLAESASHLNGFECVECSSNN